VSVDPLLFAWVKARLDDSSVTDIIMVDTSIVRDDFAHSLLDVLPRVEYNPYRTRQETLSGTVTKEDGEFGITVVTNRNDGFGDGDTPEASGDLHNLMDAVLVRLTGQTPTLTGYVTGRLKYRGARRTTLSDPNIVSKRLDFSIKVYDNLTTPPIAGDEGTLTIDGYSGTVVRWVAFPDARHDTDATSDDDANPTWEPNDPTNRVRVWFLPEKVSQPFKRVGSTVTANFSVGSASWTQSLKLDRYTWPQDMRDNDPVMVTMDFVDDDASSPWLTGVVV